MNTTKILIIRFSSIGDIVLTSPIVRCIKKQLKNAEIHYLTKKVFADVLIHNPYIDKLHFIDAKVSEIIPQLKRENFSHIIDLHHNVRSKKVKWSLGVPSSSFNKLNFKKWLIVNAKINRLPAVHIVDRYFEALHELKVKNDGQGLDYFITQEEERVRDILPLSFKKEFDCLVLGGSYYTKKIPFNKLAEICERNPRPLVLLGGKEEANEASKLSSHFPNNVFNACGILSLNQSAGLIKHSNRVYTSDTGLMHIAAAYKRRIISLWGNTIPEFGMSPYQPGKNSEILEVKGLNCRPCSKLGFGKCPKKHFRCMNDLALPARLFE